MALNLYLNLDPVLDLNLNLALFPASFVGRITDTFLGMSLALSPSRSRSRLLCRFPPELPWGHGRGFLTEWD